LVVLAEARGEYPLMANGTARLLRERPAPQQFSALEEKPYPILYGLK